MSSDTTSSSSSLDSSCRILTVSPSLEQAINFIDRIRILDRESQSPAQSTDLNQDDEQTLGRSATIPWTLSNKYYQADVHFHAREVKGLAPHHSLNVPAVIFVWSNGDSYRDHVVRIANDISARQPDVALAVRMPRSSPENEISTEVEEDGEIDEFLSSHGFEFINGEVEYQRHERTEDEGLPEHGIPGLPRVVDSLSTIMWPSMSSRAPTKPKFNRQRLSLFSRRSSKLDSLRLHKEAEDLVRWLEDDPAFRDIVKNDPWKSVSEPGTVSTSPTSSDPPLAPWSLPSRAGPPSILAFDDDFADFVSAPREPSSGRTTPHAQSPTSVAQSGSLDEEGLRSPFSSTLYRALGSAANLAASQEEEIGDAKQTETSDDDDDDDLPSQQEIAVTAARIFGTDKSRSSATRVDASADVSPVHPTSSLFAVDSMSSQDPTSMQVVDLYDVGQFDLSRVLDALRGMKAEIASMSDEGERRRAAARVALGLVYGLEGESPDDAAMYT
ncbi:hypothetical protein AB1N83_002806 [Pleurotus pulmonarius]